MRLTSALPMLLLIPLLGLTACQQDVVNRKAVGILNERARLLAETGNLQSAIGRLEAAVDLMPNETVTLNNLAIAYQPNLQSIFRRS